MAALLRLRRDTFLRERDGIAAERTHLQSEGLLGPTDVAVFRRGELLRAAEIAWLDETLETLSTPTRETQRDERDEDA